MFPNRSGGQVTYLEQAYPKPAFLFQLPMRSSLSPSLFLAAMRLVSTPEAQSF
jgi:hypothetical protein